MSAPLVLVVDDDPDMLDLETDTLARAGYRVARAENGMQALERITEEIPAAVLLDMRMPVMDGWAFARALRDKYGRSIPIVVITAAEDSKLRADEVGAEASLGKPIELEALLETVGDVAGAAR